MEWPSISRQLLTVKVFYFFSLSGFGSLFPYLPLVATQLGLTQAEIGTVFGVIPFITFFKNLLLGLLVDRFQKHKQALAASCFLAAVFHLCLIVIPQVLTLHSVGVTLSCDNATELLACGRDIRTNDNFCYLQETTSSAQCSLICEGKNSSMLSSPEVSFSSSDRFGVHDTRSRTPSSDSTVYYGIGNATSPGDSNSCQVDKVAVLDDCLSLEVSKCSPIHRACTGQPGDTNGQQSMSYVRDGVTGYDEVANVTCVLSCNEVGMMNATCSTGFTGTLTFWLFLIFIVFGAESNSSELMLNDAIAYNILGDDRHAWGLSRLFGTVGYGLTAVTISILLDTTVTPGAEVDYSVGFYMYAVLSVCAGVTALFHKIDKQIHCQQVFKHASTALSSPPVVAFLCVMISLGVLNGMWLTFLFTFLRVELGASLTVIGLCILIQSAAELALLFTSGWIVSRIGEVFCLYLAFAAYIARFLAYTYLENYWFALPVELLHSLTYGLMYAAASIYTSRIAPPGTMGTLQGVLNAVHFGLAYGLGSLIGGTIVNAYKFRFLFKVAAVIAGVSLVLFVIFQEGIMRILPVFYPEQDKLPVHQSAGGEEGGEVLTDTEGQHAATSHISNGNSPSDKLLQGDARSPPSLVE